MAFFKPRRTIECLVIIILFIGLAIQVLSIREKSLTYDEAMHFSYGERVLEGSPDRVYRSDNSKMPIAVLNVLISRSIHNLDIHNFVSRIPILDYFLKPFYRDRVYAGRLLTPLFGMALSLLIFFWTKELYGFAGGLISLITTVFSPNIIAHSRLVTTDIFATFFIALSIFLFRKLLLKPSSKNALLVGLSFGLALLTKYTSLMLIPIFFLLLFFRFIISYFIEAKSNNSATAQNHMSFKKWMGYSSMSFLTAIIVVNSGFGLAGSFDSLKSFSFRSEKMKTLNNSIGTLNKIPIPLPKPFIDGIDYCLFDEQRGPDCNIYLHGHIKYGNKFIHDVPFSGFKGYFFWCSLFKIPVVVLALFFIAFFISLKDRRDLDIKDNELFLLIPLLFFVLYFNFFFNTDLGIRYFLVSFPFAFIFIGIIGKNWSKYKISSKLIITILIIYMSVHSVLQFPNYIAYFNELVPDKMKAYQLLADSNLNWNQDIFALKIYCKNHPDAVYNPPKPQAGHLVVDTNYLVGVFGDEYKFSWLRDHFKPVGHINYAYLIYKIQKNEIIER